MEIRLNRRITGIVQLKILPQVGKDNIVGCFKSVNKYEPLIFRNIDFEILWPIISH